MHIFAELEQPLVDGKIIDGRDKIIFRGGRFEIRVHFDSDPEPLRLRALFVRHADTVVNFQVADGDFIHDAFQGVRSASSSTRVGVFNSRASASSSGSQRYSCASSFKITFNGSMARQR